MKIITDDSHYHTEDILKILSAKWQLLGELNNKRAINTALGGFLIFCSIFLLSISSFLPWKMYLDDIRSLMCYMKEDKGLMWEI